MSLELYWTRLTWDGSRGVAKHAGRQVQLSEAPCICGAVVDGVDYAPEVHCYQILPTHGGWREMTVDEIRGADALLVDLTREVRDA